MNSIVINPSEIKPIQCDIDKRRQIRGLFTINDESIISDERVFIEKITVAKNNTKTLVNKCIINNNKKYLLLLDSNFFIIRQENLGKYKNYFKDKMIFYTQECEQEFKNNIQEQNPPK